MGADALVISEIQFNPQAASDEDGEWIELTNTSDWNVDLRGITILDNASFHVISSESAVILKAYGTIVLARSDDFSLNGGIFPGYHYGGLVLNNSGDTLTLADGDMILDQVSFGEEFGLQGMVGSSVSLDPEATSVVANDIPGNWCPASDTYGWGDGGTPGEKNPPCLAEGATDEPSGPYGSLYLSEIMYNPSAVLDTKGEWVEIHNPTSEDVDIRGLSFADGSTSHMMVSAEPLWIPAGGYGVLSRNGSPSYNGGVTPLHVYGSITLNNPMDSLSLSYGNTVIDSVFYGVELGYSEAVGSSLQLKSSGMGSANSNDSPGDWCLSSTPFGAGDLGTPGSANSPCSP